jgi:transcriptional regulator with XRE-family HTH domain
MSVPIIRLNIEKFEKAQKDARLTGQELAEKMGLHYSTIWRVKKGRLNVGPEFIAGALRCFSNKEFNDLFYLG